jgi:hypothetical protein
MRTTTIPNPLGDRALRSPDPSILRELDHRTSDGIDVRLLWSPDTDRLFIAVEDGRLGDSLRFEVAAGEALRAFHHPYAYAAHRRVAC